MGLPECGARVRYLGGPRDPYRMVRGDEGVVLAVNGLQVLVEFDGGFRVHLIVAEDEWEVL